MSVKNRELSQFGSFVKIDDATKNIGITSESTPYVGIGTNSPTSKLHVIGDVNISGVVTSASFVGSGNNLTGIVTSITAGSNITIDQSTGNVTITASPQASFLGIATEGGIVGSGVTLIDLRGSGISTVTVSSGIATLNIMGSESTRSLYTYTATTGQTSFNASYDVGYVDVFLNGIKLSQTQYVATNGTTVNLTKGASNGDIVEIVTYEVNLIGEPTNKISISTEGGIPINDIMLLDFRESVASGVSVSSGIATISLETTKWTTGSGSNIYRTLGNIGIGTTNPTSKLDVIGDVKVSGAITSTNLSVSGVTTSSSYAISGTSVIDGSRNLLNINSFDSTVTSVWDTVGIATTSKVLVNREHVTVTNPGTTITLPASPNAGWEVTVGVGSFINTIIARNGSNIMGLAEDITIDLKYVSLNFVYTGDTTQGWRVY